MSILARHARAALLVSACARVFLGLAVDQPTTRNGAWLSVLLGGLLVMPWTVCIFRVKRAKPLSVALFIVTTVDAAAVLSALTRSAGYLALDRASPTLLALPVGFALLWCIWRNGDVVGYAAMIWARLALLLLLIVALLQCRSFTPAWLAPALGNGWPAIIEGGLRCAVWMISASAILSAAEDDDAPLSNLIPIIGAMLAAIVLLFLAGMLTPTKLGSAWLNRLDDLLCNGRTPLYLQMPLIALWFAGLLHLLAAQCFAVAALLQRLTGWDGKPCAALAVGAPLILSRLQALSRLSRAVPGWGFVAIGTLTALSMLFQKGGLAACDSGN